MKMAQTAIWCQKRLNMALETTDKVICVTLFSHIDKRPQVKDNSAVDILRTINVTDRGRITTSASSSSSDVALHCIYTTSQQQTRFDGVLYQLMTHDRQSWLTFVGWFSCQRKSAIKS